MSWNDTQNRENLKRIADALERISKTMEERRADERRRLLREGENTLRQRGNISKP